MTKQAERVIDLPIFTTRLRPEYKALLRATAEVTSEPIYKLVPAAIDLLLDTLPAADRKLVDKLVQRRSKG